MTRLSLSLSVLCVVLVAAAAPGAEKAPPARPRTVEQLAEKVRPSIVVITVRGRSGKEDGLGTGFVLSADGLIATNRHVIGDGRALRVETADGKSHEVTAVHAADRKLDLAIIRIDARGLTPLELGDSSALKDGQAVVAVGNPRGLKHSVVSGVISGKRTLEGRPMIQVAIPIEPGNSGGPLLDMHGRVQGVLTLKSLVTPNLGFAVTINALKPLLRKPNPVPMSAWLTIGALDPEEWRPKLGGHWRQRAGRIIAEGTGKGIGRRTLCLSQRAVPALPYEVAVRVRLDDEAGAAGLVFHADGDNKHYGFYPSNHQLRLTRFDGPDVYSWKVLRQEASPYYRPGDWNTLRVRLEKDRIRCYVNGQLVFEDTDATYSTGKVGLAKFRDTRAEFKQFRVAREIPAATLPPKVLARVTRAVDAMPPGATPGADLVGRLAPEAPLSVAALRERARQLDLQAAQVRRLAQAVHQQNVLDELKRVLAKKEADVDLLHAGLLLARLDNDEVDVAGYRAQVDRMARKVVAALPKGADDRAKLQVLNKYLFTERGFHGSRGDYYNRSNSYLSEVLDDREGIPITLSVLYIEMARRLGVRVVGVGLPAHFVVRHVPAKGKPQLIDVYEGGRLLSKEDAAKKVEELTGRPLEDAHLAAVSKQDMLLRMLANLLRVAEAERDLPGMLRYLDAMLTVDPSSAVARLRRGMARAASGDRKGALADVDWLLEKRPEGLDVDKLQEYRRTLTEGRK